MSAIDQLLIAGIKLGPNEKHEAINKILKLVPETRRLLAPHSAIAPNTRARQREYGARGEQSQ